MSAWLNRASGEVMRPPPMNIDRMVSAREMKQQLVSMLCEHERDPYADPVEAIVDAMCRLEELQR